MQKLLLTLLFCGASILHASAEKYMTIVFDDGSEQSFLMSSQPIVTFGSESLYVELLDASAGKVSSIKVEKTTVKRYYFSDEATGVESVQKADDGMSVCGDRIVVRGAKGEVGVYRTDGTRVEAEVGTDGDRTVVSLERLAKGTYVVRSGKNVVKLTKN